MFDFFLSGRHQSISSMEERSILLTIAATVPIIDHTSSTYLLSGRIENWLVSICCYLIPLRREADLCRFQIWGWLASESEQRAVPADQREREERHQTACLLT